ncbi:iron-sulfur protein [Mediterranea sp. An20]|uniref:flavodoxin family protein n=1 Tax=Mediterranea sp. An20 TaxID=1965586 RepID=UPI000B3972AC|nr:flavodoxin family protein [Mediterranea sp. An20]OUP07908.1 iron-sulfur protein [Mediterranea sp. An20]
MKILILNASPRCGGNISRMLDAMKQEAEGLGYEVMYETVSHLAVRPCTGCMKCRTSGHCILPSDDAQRMLSLIGAADVLVVGSPCYWGNMPGTLKVLFDRIVYGLMGESPHGMPLPLHKGKRAILVTACTTPWPFNIWFRQSRGTVRALREILKWSGFRIVRSIERGGTKTHPLTERNLERCRRAVRRLD